MMGIQKCKVFGKEIFFAFDECETRKSKDLWNLFLEVAKKGFLRVKVKFLTTAFNFASMESTAAFISVVIPAQCSP